jgi:hypothetical protein
MAKAVVFEENHIVGSIKNKNYNNAKIIYKAGNAKIKEVLPFRVKFINIGIEGYGPNNVPPIGIAIIAYNNYIA